MKADSTEPQDPLVQDPPLDDPNLDFFDYEEELYSPQRYRKINLLAVLSVVAGALSIVTLFHWYLGLIPVAGIILALLAQRQINRAPEEYSAHQLVAVGLGLSVGMWLIGAGILKFTHFREVPTGYKAIGWDALRPDPATGELVSKEAIELDDKRIYLKGYMYPGRQVINLKEFLLVPSQGHCKFCSSQIARHEIVRVKFVGDYKADYTTYQIGVGGMLKVEQNPTVHASGGLPYTIEADVFQ